MRWGFRYSVGLLCLSTQALAGAPVLFPNTAPVGDLAPDQVVKSFYAGEQYAPNRGPCVTAHPCQVLIKQEGKWEQAGRTHWTIITSAEDTTDYAAHVDGALLGILDLVRSTRGWELASGSPIVAEEGAFGRAPKITASIENHHLVVTTEPMSMNQGQIVGHQHIFLLSRHVWRLALSFRNLFDSSGYCRPKDAACRRQDFTSAVSYIKSLHGFTVHQVITPYAGKAIVHNYHCNVYRGVCK